LLGPYKSHSDLASIHLANLCFHFPSFSLGKPTLTSIQGPSYSPPLPARICHLPLSFVIGEDRIDHLLLPV
jgi:hypothetical protein